eukprot:jgi/Hompol1/6451/HPOL_003456-RA
MADIRDEDDMQTIIDHIIPLPIFEDDFHEALAATIDTTLALINTISAAETDSTSTANIEQAAQSGYVIPAPCGMLYVCLSILVGLGQRIPNVFRVLLGRDDDEWLRQLRTVVMAFGVVELIDSAFLSTLFDLIEILRDVSEQFEEAVITLLVKSLDV